MQNRLPFAQFVEPVAEYLKHHSDKFASDGPAMMTPIDVANRCREIERCADEMRHSTDYPEFEAALDRSHKLGMFPPMGLVCQVAQASVMAD